jgi:spore maturation protein CgeB
MRIFCAVRHSCDPKYYYGGLWSANFYPALREMGQEIVESQVDLLHTSRFMDIPGDFTRQELQVRARTTELILEEVRAAHRAAPIDLFLSYFYNAHFDPAGFSQLRSLGIPSVNFYCNSIYQFELVAAVAAGVDFAWHAEKDARQAYLRIGANPVWVQMAADSQLYRPIPGLRRLPLACFVGQRYADRDRWLASLIRAGVPVEIFGPGWSSNEDCRPLAARDNDPSPATYLGRRRPVPGTWRSYMNAARENVFRAGVTFGVLRSARQLNYRRQARALTPLISRNARGPVEPQAIATVFAQHEVCLNFSNVWSDGRSGSSLIPHVRLRDFEAPMCRTCYLTADTEEIAEFYHVGREIDTYRCPEELVDKTRFYLHHRGPAEKLRDAGYRRALREHRWRHRFEELFSKIGLSHAAEVVAFGVQCSNQTLAAQ